MVTAGVYLIVRTHAIFEAAPDVQHLAAILGAITLIMAGLIALVQWDIKRVIAYSTMSQIGYMFLAAGIGAYDFAMFHLMTHAFFKALLFLGAGIVIHRLAGEQDIRKMGGLHRYMPLTSIMFLVGTLALMGIPPLSGFWSKDAILASALADGGVLGYSLYVAGLVGAILTGMYALRLYLLVFRGEPSADAAAHFEGSADAHATEHGAHPEDAHVHHGEGPLSMILPVFVLSVLAVVGGFVDVPGVISAFANWINPYAEPLVEPSTAEDYGTSLIAVVAALAGAFVAWTAFKTGREIVGRALVRRVFEHKFYFDELYDAVFSRPAQLAANLLRERVEEPVVQGSLGEIGSGVDDVADGTARLQSGMLRSYALVVSASVAILVVVFVAVR
jgi:NADH-quinone oxidoreductase subunit L